MCENGDKNKRVEHIPFPLESGNIDGFPESVDEIFEGRTDKTCKDVDYQKMELERIEQEFILFVVEDDQLTKGLFVKSECQFIGWTDQIIMEKQLFSELDNDIEY